MIGFNKLGNYGRLGNQMFQYAALRGIAAHNTYDWCVPPAEQFGISDYKVRETNNNLYDCFQLDSIQHYGLIDGIEYVNESSRYDPNLFNISDNTSIAGYFQSERYFAHISDDIRTDFTFKDHVTDQAVSVLAGLKGGKPLVSVHVRRSDYLHNPEVHTDLFLSGYYHRAMAEFADVDFLIISDDVNWCQQQVVFQSSNIKYTSGNHSFVDMCIMSRCDANIIANSSFSWWASYLNASDLTVAPANWFGPVVDFDPADYLYRKEWRVV